jgi:hypothetical protein
MGVAKKPHERHMGVAKKPHEVRMGVVFFAPLGRCGKPASMSTFTRVISH